QCDSLIAQINAKSIENSHLNAQLQEKVFAITTLKNELRKLKGKNVVNTAVSKHNATIAPGMFKLDIEPISPRLKNNRDAHEELLVYVSQTCPNLLKPSGKLVAVTPVTSSNNIPKQTDSLKTKDCNTKNNRITRPPSSNPKNKLEDHSRKVKSSLNKTNSVSKPNGNALVKHSVRNAKFESICATCNKCFFDANHDMCLIDFVNDVNVRSKSKRNKMRKVWKPTGKVFTDVGYKWKPTRIFLTIVGNSYPLTRITPKKIMHLKETTSKSVETPKPEIKVYSRRPKRIKSVGFPDRSLTKSWLWHRRLSHFNFGTLNKLAKDGLAQDNGIEFVNQTLHDFYANVSISHQTLVARAPQQNGVVERWYLTLMEAARTMLIFSKAPQFLWAEEINTACYTQNRSLIRLRYNKTPYELMHEKKSDLSFFHVFGSLYYPTNDSEGLGKLYAKVDIDIFVSYTPAKKAFRIYSRRTQKIMETIHVTFDELTVIAS
ncbi:retrovirus-related pol polyprotein from transposon TNT 1-94, partial [Tanacetum coccineum]